MDDYKFIHRHHCAATYTSSTGGIGAKIADFASEKLGTEVRIGHVDLGFLNRVIIDDLLIYDQHHKKMLSASRIGARSISFHSFNLELSIYPLHNSLDWRLTSTKQQKTASPTINSCWTHWLRRTKVTKSHCTCPSIVLSYAMVPYDIINMMHHKHPTDSTFITWT